MAEYVGRAKDPISQNMVDVFTDKNGLAYYKDGPTGVKVNFTVKRVSDAFLSTIQGVQPAQSATQEPAKRGGFFDGVLA